MVIQNNHYSTKINCQELRYNRKKIKITIRNFQTTIKN